MYRIFKVLWIIDSIYVRILRNRLILIYNRRKLVLYYNLSTKNDFNQIKLLHSTTVRLFENLRVGDFEKKNYYPWYCCLSRYLFENQYWHQVKVILCYLINTFKIIFLFSFSHCNVNIILSIHSFYNKVREECPIE